MFLWLGILEAWLDPILDRNSLNFFATIYL